MRVRVSLPTGLWVSIELDATQTPPGEDDQLGPDDPLSDEQQNVNGHDQKSQLISNEPVE